RTFIEGLGLGAWGLGWTQSAELCLYRPTHHRCAVNLSIRRVSIDPRPTPHAPRPTPHAPTQALEARGLDARVCEGYTGCMITDGELTALATRVGAHLRETERRLVSAESCTGGWIGKVVTDIPGSSDWY